MYYCRLLVCEWFVGGFGQFVGGLWVVYRSYLTPLNPALVSLGLLVVVYAYEQVSPANFPSYHEIKLHIIFLLEIKA